MIQCVDSNESVRIRNTGISPIHSIDYMTENNLHEHLQSAYKPGHSTETALVKVQNDILTSIDQHGVVILVM